MNKTGKSSLVETLHLHQGFSKYYDRDFLFTGEYSNEEIAVMIRSKIFTQAGMCRYIKGNLLFDRAHLSELVYGSIDRGYMMTYQREAEKIFKESDVKLVLCTDSLENVNERNGKDMTRYYELMNMAYDISILDKMQFNMKDVEDWIRLRKFLNI